MKIVCKISIVVWSFFIFETSAQIVYSEDFGTGCSTNQLATTFGWTNTNTGTNQAIANIWYVSAAERGMGAGNCGAGCGGTNDRTLHLSTDAAIGGDLGAAYFESSALLCSFFGLCSITDKRIESPNIDCTGISSIPFTFEYMENGEGVNDNGTVWYSADGGTIWSLLDNCPKTTICTGGQGEWTARSLTLPTSADNNSTVKIGFRWVNNGNGVGTDPSFAIDNIVVGTPVSLGVQMVSMDVICNSENQPTVYWTTQHEENASHFNVYKSDDGENWRIIESINCTNEYNDFSNYSAIDVEGILTIAYYFIDQVDFDGRNTSYEIISKQSCIDFTNQLVVFPNPSDGNELNFRFADLIIETIDIYSIEGKKIKEFKNDELFPFLTIYPNLEQGRYFARVHSQAQSDVVMIEIH